MTDFLGPPSVPVPIFLILSPLARNQAGQMHVAEVARRGLFHVACMANFLVCTTSPNVTFDYSVPSAYMDFKKPNHSSINFALQHLDSKLCACIQASGYQLPSKPNSHSDTYPNSINSGAQCRCRSSSFERSSIPSGCPIHWAVCQLQVVAGLDA